MIRARENDLITGIVIELKYSKIESGLERDCRDALNQINTRNYIQSLQKTDAKDPKVWHCLLASEMPCNG